MRLRRREPQLNPQRAALFADFVNACRLLEPDDAQAIAEKFAKISTRDWYSDAADVVWQAAKQSCRIEHNEVVGDFSDPDVADLQQLAELVDGGSAVDVALAVLVEDLVDEDVYQKVTTWWGRFESTWLPEDEQQPAPAAEPAPADPPAPPAEHLPPPRPRPRPRPGQTQRRTAAVIPGELIVTPPVPPTRPAQVVPQPSPQQVMAAAMRMAMNKEKRTWKVRRLRALGGVLLVLGALIALCGFGWQLGNPDLPPAGWLGQWGSGWPGRFICAILWLILGITIVVFAAGRFARANQVRRGKS